MPAQHDKSVLRDLTAESQSLHAALELPAEGLSPAPGVQGL